jgi:glycosyltransferase involved in cell wall biosynthesis
MPKTLSTGFLYSMSSTSCTTAILTYNSANTLRQALMSVAGVGPIVICDGGSTDETLELAREFGATVILQDPAFKNADGSLRDYSGVRNQLLAQASGWIFFLDSDEYASPALVEELKKLGGQPPAAYWVPRHYTLGGVAIDCASTYPNRQMRLFHTSVAHTFIKEVHERIQLLPGTTVAVAQGAIMTPLPSTPQEMVSKWRRYLRIEAGRRGPVSVRAWMLTAVHEAGVAGLLLWRMLRHSMCRRRLPWGYELPRLWYQWRLIADSWRSVSRW